MSVSDLRTEVASMQARAAVCQTLDGGTEAMRAAGSDYLPRWKAEEKDDWEARLKCTTLFPAMAKTLDTMVGKPFSEPIVLDGPNSILAHTENIDMAGRDLDTFARDITRAALRDGITWVLVDYPRVRPAANLAAERATGARPYWVHVPLASMLGWKTQTISGKVTLSQLRIRESVEIDVDEWTTKTEVRTRVLTPGWVKVYGPNGELLEDGPTSMQEIPLVAFYGKRMGFFSAEPPLADLAWLNVQHWQSGSDQRNILHKARVPFLAADADNRDEKGAELVFSAGIFVGFENLHSVSFDSAPIESGRQDLLDLEDQMRRVAGELLSRTAGDKSATEAGLEASEGSAWLKGKMRTFQDALEECFRFHAAWMKESSPVTVTLAMDWDEAAVSAQILQQLTTARQAGIISQETYSHNIQAAGLMPEGRTVDQEIASLEAEGPQSFASPAKTTPNEEVA